MIMTGIYKLCTLGLEEAWPKAYIYCFSDIIILLKCVQGGRGQISGLFELTHFMDDPIGDAQWFL